MNQNYSFICTCFNRSQELMITIKTFLDHADQMPSEWIFTDDSGIESNDISKAINYFDLNNCRIIKNSRNIGQLASIDIAYSLCTNEFIFHCEEDWQFLKSGFISESFKILEKYDDCITVWLRAVTDTNNHKTEICPERGITLMQLHHGQGGKWNGFTFNPGMRRRSDYEVLKPFCRFKGERDISFAYYLLGYRAAIIGQEQGYVRHIGLNSTYGRNWSTLSNHKQSS